VFFYGLKNLKKQYRNKKKNKARKRATPTTSSINKGQPF
jgi:hypothetical protein